MLHFRKFDSQQTYFRMHFVILALICENLDREQTQIIKQQDIRAKSKICECFSLESTTFNATRDVTWRFERELYGGLDH